MRAYLCVEQVYIFYSDNATHGDDKGIDEYAFMHY